MLRWPIVLGALLCALLGPACVRSGFQPFVETEFDAGSLDLDATAHDAVLADQTTDPGRPTDSNQPTPDASVADAALEEVGPADVGSEDASSEDASSEDAGCHSSCIP